MAVKITDRIGTFGESDIYATHDGNRGALGFHAVNSTTERNQITYDRRRGSYQVDGQPPLPFFVSVRTLDDVKLYWLKNEPGTPETTDADWEEFIAGSEDPFQGFFNPTSATFIDGTGTKGHYWIASVTGSYDAGSGIIDYAQYDKAQYDGFVWQKVGGSSASVAWSDIQNKPSQFLPSSHSHTISEVTSLQTELNKKVNTIDIVQSITTAVDKVPSSNAVYNYTYSQATINTLLSNLSVYGIKYSWVNQNQQDAQTGMQLGELGLRSDQQIAYRWEGTAWNPFFNVASGGGSLTEAIVSDVNVGCIEVGDPFPIGTSFTAFVKALLTQIVPPTYTNPTFDELEILDKDTVTPNVWEVGEYVDININPVYEQNDGGEPDYYALIQDGTVLHTATIPSYIPVPSFQINENPVQFEGLIHFTEGPIKNDSSGSPDSNGRIPQQDVRAYMTINAYRNLFYDLNNEYSDSNAVRDSTWTISNPVEELTFEINIPIGTTDVSFAYPATLRDVSRVLDTGSNYDIKSSFIQVGFDVEGANGFDPVPYKVYKFHPALAFTRAVKYIITI